MSMPNKKQKGFNYLKKATDQDIAGPLPSNNRGSIRKQWSNEQMLAALKSQVLCVCVCVRVCARTCVRVCDGISGK